MLTEKFMVRTRANKLQNLRIPLAVDPQQVSLQVAFAMVAPVAGQSVVAVLFRKSFILRQE